MFWSQGIWGIMLLPCSKSIPLHGAVHTKLPEFAQEKDLPTATKTECKSSLGLPCEQSAREPLNAGRAHQVQQLNSSNLASHFQKIQKIKIYDKNLITG